MGINKDELLTLIQKETKRGAAQEKFKEMNAKANLQRFHKEKQESAGKKNEEPKLLGDVLFLEERQTLPASEFSKGYFESKKTKTDARSAETKKRQEEEQKKYRGYENLVFSAGNELTAKGKESKKTQAQKILEQTKTTPDWWINSAISALGRGDKTDNATLYRNAISVIDDSKYSGTETVREALRDQVSWKARPIQNFAENFVQGFNSMPSSWINFANAITGENVSFIRDMADFVNDIDDGYSARLQKSNEGAEFLGTVANGLGYLSAMIAFGGKTGSKGSVPATLVKPGAIEATQQFAYKAFTNPAFYSTFMSAAGNKYKQERDENKSKNAALGNSTLSGLGVALLEIAGGFGSNSGDMGTFLQTVAGETLEELSQNWYEAIIDKFTTHPETKWLSLDETVRSVLNPRRDFQTALATMAISGITGAGNLINDANNFNQKRVQKKAQAKRNAETAGNATKRMITNYTEDEISNLSSSKIIIEGADDTFEHFADVALSGDTKGFKKLYLGKINPVLSRYIKNEIGVDVENYNVSISNDTIRKIFKSHGTEKTEAPRGQVPVTVEMLQNLKEVITNPDKILPAGVTRQGKPAIKFAKKIGDTLVAIEYVSDNHKTLDLQTFYAIKGQKNKPATAYDAQMPRIYTSETSSGTAYINSIPQNSGKNNSEINERFKMGQNDTYFSYAGRKAQSPDIGTLAKAKRLRRQGASNEQIYYRTGWFVGLDGKWRFEIDDSGMKVDVEAAMERWLSRAVDELRQEEPSLSEEEAREYILRTEEPVCTIGDIVSHPKLFEQYPDLKDIPVSFAEDVQGNGDYNPATDSIRIKKGNPDIKGTLCHELQHAIQAREGFTLGSNPDMWTGTEEEKFEQYMNTAGEIEAREVRNRRFMSEFDRQNTMPFSDVQGAIYVEDAPYYHQNSKAESEQMYDSKAQEQKVKAARQVMDILSSAYGTKFAEFDGPAAVNGRYNPETRTVYINRNSEEPVLGVIAHELIHDLKVVGGETYQMLRQAVNSDLNIDEFYRYKKSLLETYDEMGVDYHSMTESELYDYVLEEAMADLCSEVMRDPETISRIAKKDMNLAQRLVNKLDEIIARIREAFAQFFGGENQEIRNLVQHFNEVKAVYQATLQGLVGKTGQVQGNVGEDAKFSIEKLPGGKQYVQADRQVISGNDPKRWAEQVEAYINTNIRNGQDVVVYGVDGDRLTITSDTSGKARFRNTIIEKGGIERPMTDKEYGVKLRAESHIDEVSKVSKRGKKDVPDTKNHPFAKDGFNYRTAYFMDEDGSYYRLTISVGKNGEVNTVYNVGKLKEAPFPLSGSTAGRNSAYGGTSNNSVPQQSGTVKTNIRQNSEGDTQNGEKLSVRRKGASDGAIQPYRKGELDVFAPEEGGALGFSEDGWRGEGDVGAGYRTGESYAENAGKKAGRVTGRRARAEEAIRRYEETGDKGMLPERSWAKGYARDVTKKAQYIENQIQGLEHDLTFGLSEEERKKVLGALFVLRDKHKGTREDAQMIAQLLDLYDADVQHFVDLVPVIDDIKDVEKGFDAWTKGSYYFKDLRRIFEDVFGKHFGIAEPLLDSFDDGKRDYAEEVVSTLTDLRQVIVKKLGIKPKTKEAAAVQWIAEGERNPDMKQKADQEQAEAIREEMFAEELKKGTVRPEDKDKFKPNIRMPYTEEMLTAEFGTERAADIQEAAAWFRGQYDRLVDELNRTRARMYPGQPDKLIHKRKDYMRHFKEISTGFRGLLDIAGMENNISPELVLISDKTKPKKKWQSFEQARTGRLTDEDAVSGFMEYLPQAAYAIHIDPFIVRFRTLARDLVKLKAETNNPDADGFIKYLDEFANYLAGKTSSFDRPLMNALGSNGRTAMRGLNWFNNRTKADAVLGNVASVSKQVMNLPNGIALLENPANILPGLVDVFKGIDGQSDVAAAYKKSGFLKERFMDKAFSKFEKNGLGKGAKWLLGIADEFGTRAIWNAAYREGVKLQKAGEIPDAVRYADNLTRRAVGGRGIGEVPLMYETKIGKLFMPFQVEVTNTWNVYRDVLQGKSGTGKHNSAMDKTLRMTLNFMLVWGMNAALQELTGSKGSFDPLGDIFEGLMQGFGEKEDEDLFDKLLQGGKRAGQNLAGDFLGSRPLGWLAGSVLDTIDEDWSNGTFYAAQGANVPAVQSAIKAGKKFKDGNTVGGAAEIATSFLLPYGGKQLDKTARGLGDYFRGGNYKNDIYKELSTGERGDKRYDIEQTVPNAIKSALFGPNSLQENRTYWGEKDRKDYLSSVESKRKQKEAESFFDAYMKAHPDGEVAALYKETKRKEVIPFEAVARERTFTSGGKEQVVKLTDEQLTDYQQKQNKLMELYYSDAVRSEAYKSGDTDTKMKILEEARKEAKTRISAMIKNDHLYSEPVSRAISEGELHSKQAESEYIAKPSAKTKAVSDRKNEVNRFITSLHNSGRLYDADAESLLSYLEQEIDMDAIDEEVYRVETMLKEAGAGGLTVSGSYADLLKFTEDGKDYRIPVSAGHMLSVVTDTEERIRKMLTTLFDSSAYQNANVQEKAKMIKKVKKDAREAIEEGLKRKFTPVRVDYFDKLTRMK